MEYIQDVPEDSSDPKEVEDEDEHEEREEGRGKKDCPPHCKRQRAETAGEEWEAVSPIKWKRSPLSKHSRTFASLNPEGKGRQWPGSQEESIVAKGGKIVKEGRPARMTPVRIKVKRLEVATNTGRNKAGMSPSHQTKISRYLTSTVEEEGGEV